MKDTFLIEEVSNYKLYLYDQVAHDKDAEEAISLKFSGGTIFFVFVKGGVHANKKMKWGNEDRYFIYLDTSKYDRFVDLLRYEKPVYLALETKEMWAYLTTEDEPVGEGDNDQS